MNNENAIRPIMVAAALLMSGCMAATSIQFDYKPKELRLQGDAAAGGKALVLGQAYLRGYGNWVQLVITSVDETKTFSQTQLRPTINFLVPAGKRTMNVRVLLGNEMKWNESADSQIAVELQEGLVYQVKAREATDIRGVEGVDLWIEQLGSIAEYEYFLQRNRDYKQGQPLTRGEMTGLP
jgi:hypothetical protein